MKQSLKITKPVFLLGTLNALPGTLLTPFYDLSFLHKEFDFLIFLKFDDQQVFSDGEINRLSSIIQRTVKLHNDCFVVVTHGRELPQQAYRADEFVHSFGCDFTFFKKMIHKSFPRVSAAEISLFDMVDTIFNNLSDFRKIIVRQISASQTDDDSLFTKETTQAADVIIPHFGDETFLESLLPFLHVIPGIDAYIGLDGEATEKTRAIRKRFSNYHFYTFSPFPAGPYVIRNSLISQGKNELLFFQDSDDIPCFDRFRMITDFIIKNDCQLCGSHELRMDYFNRSLQAIRFPTDVTASLRAAPCHALLHPTSALQREAFFRAGRLSENRRFGNDTQFLLRSFFYFKSIRNIDAFLYIRRIRSNSLTTSPATRLGSPERVELINKWEHDFKAIKNGSMDIDSSSLQYFGSEMNVMINEM